MTDQPSKPRASFIPSASTGGSALGGALAVIVLATLHQGLHWDIDLETAAAITTICCTIAGYIPQSGRTQLTGD